MPTLITDIPFDVLFELKKYLDLRSLIRLKLTSNHFWEWGKLNESKIAPSFVEIQSIINHTNDVTSISNTCSSLSDYATGSISQNIPVKFQPSPKFDWTYILSLLPFSCRFCQCSIRINFLNIFLTEKLKWVSINYCDKHNNFISSETSYVHYIQIFQSIDELSAFVQSNIQKMRISTKEFRYFAWDEYSVIESSDTHRVMQFDGYQFGSRKTSEPFLCHSFSMSHLFFSPVY